jgi:hypothetical protein
LRERCFRRWHPGVGPLGARRIEQVDVPRSPPTSAEGARDLVAEQLPPSQNCGTATSRNAALAVYAKGNSSASSIGIQTTIG